MCFSVSSKSSLQHFAVLHFRHIDQTPARQRAAASSRHLIAEQADNPILDAVVVRLNDALLFRILEPEQMFRSNGIAQKAIQVHLGHHYQYFLALGGINDTSTGSN